MGRENQLSSKASFYLAQIKDSIKNKLQTTFLWLDTDDGEILLRGIETLSPFIINDPIGLFAPFILELADKTVRKPFLKNLTNIGDEMTREKSNLNMEFIQSHEGQKLLKDTLRRITQETNEEKVEYLKKFLLNSYSDKKPNSELIDTFFGILTNMKPIHIKLLTILKNPKEVIIQISNERKKQPRPIEDRHYGKKDCVVCWSEDSDDDLNNFYVKTDPVIYSNAHKDLVTWNILENKIPKFWIYFDEPEFSNNLIHHLRDLNRWITPFGKQFLNYLYTDDSERMQKSL